MADTMPNLPEAALLARFYEELMGVETTDQAFQVLAATAAQLGFDHLAFITRASGREWMYRITASTYPRQWLQRYAEQNYGATDPVRVRGLNQSKPFTWEELQAGLDRSERRIFREAETFGLRSGIATPVFDHIGLVSGLSCASSDPRAADPRLKRLVRLMANHFSSTYEELAASPAGWPTGSPLPEPLPRLSVRELTVLELAARGAGNLNISCSLGISENTVEFHFKNILRKLGAGNRMAAVVTALRRGLITG